MPDTATEARPVNVRIRGLSKRFGAVRALSDFDLDLYGGEIHGILGQNGSGKSTFVKLLTGYHDPDGDGTCEIGGESVALPMRDMQSHGIAVIHQDLGLEDSLTIMENMGVGLQYGRRSFAICNWRQQTRECNALLSEFGLDVDPGTRVGDVSPAERAIIAVARALRTLRRQERVYAFLLDEPTAYMPVSEAHRVLALMRDVASTGAAVIFISHRIEEVLGVTDRVTVLRDGRRVGTVATEPGISGQLLKMMLGEEGEQTLASADTTAIVQTSTEPAALRAEGISGNVVADVSFEVAPGEILGLTGLTGMGQEELPYLIAGAVKPTAGRAMTASGREVGKSPASSFSDGVVLVPADRRGQGVWLGATASENITLPNLGRYFRGMLHRREEVREADVLMREFHVRPPAPTKYVSDFSGGNQQKILLAKWLQNQPKVLLLAEPTQGVDVGARHEIHEILRKLAGQGTAVVVSSADQEELALLCHRVLVMADGRVRTSLKGAAVTQEAIVAACQAERQPSEAPPQPA